MGGIEQERALDVLRDLARDCTRCPLAASRTRVVFGHGVAAARLAIVGEAPGAAEDSAGQPFVGAAGLALDQLLEASGLARSETYVTNTVKCRPPGNRPPTPAELDACAPLLDLELAVVRPRVVLALGATAARRLTGVARLVDAREADTRNDGATVVATYHPSPSGLNREQGRRSLVLDDLRRVAQLVAAPLADDGGPGSIVAR